MHYTVAYAAVGTDCAENTVSLLLSNDYCLVVRLAVVVQQRVYMPQYYIGYMFRPTTMCSITIRCLNI
jgi:hypothetical protein